MLAGPQLLMEIFMAMAMGGLIGLEREHVPEKKYAGLRTLALLAGVAPAVVAASEKAGTPVFVAIYLLLAVAISLGILLVRLYMERENIGFTTSVAAFVSAVLGVLIGYGLYSEATSLAILSALLLAEKETLHSYVDRLREEEIASALQLGAFAFILLPILPATAIDPFNAIVPRQIMLLGVFVLLIEFASYISMRQLAGSSGIYLTGLLGGGASSFATTGVMARLGNRGDDLLKPASAGALLATFSMLIRDIGIATVIILPVIGYQFSRLYPLYLPVTGMLAVIGVAAWLSRGRNKEEFEMTLESPFSIKSGIKFALIFALASVASVLGREFLGSFGVYATAFIGGVASSAAVVSSAATSYSSGAMGLQLSTGMMLSAIAGSIVAKVALVEVVNRDMRYRISAPLLLASAIGAAVFIAVQT
ncbi:MAG: MgtC/SapB family protein [Candidatus Nanohaloarchaea archaeon]